MSISGTGKRIPDGRFMEDPQLYRTIAAPGDANILPATIEAVAEVMNSKEHVDYGPSGDDNTGRRWALNNRLLMQIVIPSTISSYDLNVFGTMVGDDVVENADRWAIVTPAATYTRSQIVVLSEYPHGLLKALVTSIVGTGALKVYFSLSD